MNPHLPARWLPAGAAAALLAAALFGAGTPLAKVLLAGISPWMLAGLLYLGSGLGLATLRLMRQAPPAHLQAGEWSWLAGAVMMGMLDAVNDRVTQQHIGRSHINFSP